MYSVWFISCSQFPWWRREFIAVSYYTWFVFVRVASHLFVFMCTCVLSACHWQYTLLIVSPGHVGNCIKSYNVYENRISLSALRCIIIQLLQFEPTNAHDFINITAVLQHTSSYVIRALLAHHRWAHSCRLHLKCDGTGAETRFLLSA
jgi:hypothetical protein